MNQLLDSIVLGIIQGIAEWLPISSTGHLRLYEYFRQLTVPILFDVTLHIGTLIVIFVFFRKDIRNILTAFWRRDFKSEDGRMVPILVVGTIPIALIGLAFSGVVESTFRTPFPIAAALIICGILLYSSKIGREKTNNISYMTAILFGIAQGVSIVPGLSRSGTTIAVALLLGLTREKAFKFTFLLSIPAIIGAEAYTAIREHTALLQSGFGLTEILLGTVIAMVTGFLALNLLQRVIENKKFHLFAFYCWLLGAALIVLSLTGF